MRDLKLIDVVQAEAGDEHRAFSILLEANSWIYENFDPLWDDSEISPEELRGYIDKGELYLSFIEGDAVGTMKLQEEDMDFLPEAKAGESLFLHRLAIRRSAPRVVFLMP